MSAMSPSYLYRYPYQSHLEGGDLQLATFTPALANCSPHFFSGQLTRPRRTADLLRGLMAIVRSRFHVPASMLERMLAESDPVVTCSSGRLRFEGFSACCGAYARIDLLPGAVAGDLLGQGTTNVDFNQPMLTALAKVRDADRVTLNVGSDHVQLSYNAETVVEKKVALPARWLKGFVEVQTCQSRMMRVHEISGQEARSFLRSLPRMKTNRRETYVIASQRGLRLSQVPARNAVRVGGLERLRVLEDLASAAEALQVYGDEVTGATAWVLLFDDCRFHLVISPEVWRGFSGEGQALHAITARNWQKILPLVKANLAGQAVIDEEALHRKIAAEADVAATAIRGALSALGTQGLVGYDLAEGCWFHRELPFDLSAVDKAHPRLRDAQKLLAEQKVRIGTQSDLRTEVLVQSGDIEHRVRLTAEDVKCTCPWYAQHASTRGPCKHIIASQLFLEELHRRESP